MFTRSFLAAATLAGMAECFSPGGLGLGPSCGARMSLNNNGEGASQAASSGPMVRDACDA